MDSPELYSLTRSQLRDFLFDYGLQPFRGDQIFRWLHRDGVRTWDRMSNLSKDLRAKLSHEIPIQFPLTDSEISISNDGSVKFLLDAQGSLIESVLIPSGENDSRNFTLCVSTQAGCAMRCSFCMTGTLGFIRNLTPGEIAAQVIRAVDYIGENSLSKKEPREQWLSNIVYMGMGEPLLNVDNVVRSIGILTDKTGMDFSSRRITVSTCGVVNGIEEFAKGNTGVNLAVSLMSADDSTRSSLMPVNRKYPLNILKKALENYPLKPRQRITFEYILFKDINDSRSDAMKLVSFLSGLKAKVNIIPYNTSDTVLYADDRELIPSSKKRVLEFSEWLRSKGLTVTIRKSYGQDIKAACGLLARTKNSAESQQPQMQR
ncbi:MAG: 23S rRNA (adenine(2503)-C(2))-methyltransferase RlmN [Deltaproteobacteria bacterium]|nr:23S rRNA (adenine(2503)-C(2))-methyltransferase RlmN [Deltaproteobacteria bacterium]